MRKVFLFLAGLLLPTILSAQATQSPDTGYKPSKETIRALTTTLKTPDDVRALLAIARSTSQAVRKANREAALEKLASPDPKSAPALKDTYLALLNDPDPEIKSVASVACGTLGYQEAIPKLRRNLEAVPKHALNPEQGLNFGEYRAAMAAATALAALGDQKAVPEILDRESLSPSWELLMPKFGARVLPQIVEKARSSRVAVRHGALRTIASFHEQDAIPALKGLLSDKDKDIRSAAVRALAGSKSHEAIAAIKDAYSTLDDSGRSTVVMACLEQCDTATAMQYVKDFMHTAKQSYSRLLVVMALGKSKKPEAVPALEALLKDPNDDVRAQAACQLVGLTGKRYQYAETNWTRLAEKNCRYLKGAQK